MSEERSNPEVFLERIQRENQERVRGHLKIFFGYAAGVGKTYAMLEAAQAAKLQGVDVVAGYIEPHTRPQTMALLRGLEQLPPLVLEHKGLRLEDFDLDAAIRRKPRLILVDELAHTNAEGCRHRKRYQDIEELLKAGIDVYTTVNVQHIESLNDIVAAITGILVRERIPDRIFDEADQVELVDIEPEDLIRRLQAGKIYRPEQAERALGNFFSVENLTALREIALRRSADRVNRISSRSGGPSRGAYTDEHILVCLSSSPSNGKIIRTAARMARAFQGKFTALFVETSGLESMPEEDKKRLWNNTRLAEQLGAKVEAAYGDDIAFQIAEFARLSRVSKIVVGRSNTRRRFRLGKQSFSERLTMLAPNLDIYIIPDETGVSYAQLKAKHRRTPVSMGDVLKTTLILVLATLIGLGFRGAGFSEANIITVYILGVLITAVVTQGRACSLAASAISVLVFNFFFTYPRFSLLAYDASYPVTFIIMFAAAFLTSSLAIQIKRQAAQAARTAYRTKVLLEANQLIQQERDAAGIIRVTAGQLIKLLNCDIIHYGVEEGALTAPVVFHADGEETDVSVYTTENEQAVACWVYQNDKHAGAYTNTLGSARCMYLAVRGTVGIYGVIGVALHQELDSFENSLMLSILGECGLALEKDLFARKREEAATQAKNEQLRANLLRSISHDLRTPLTSISGNAGVLMNNGETLDANKRRELYADIYDDAMWLINLVENLLSVTRIEEGSMQLHLEAELMEEVVAEALRHVNRLSAQHTIQVRQSEDFILAKMDSRLIIQVVINLVDNAIKYTPPGSTIDISVTKHDGMVEVSVADDGPGIPDETKQRVFDMFYTINNGIADSRRSLGLGLALCKAIVAAHGGTITVENNMPKGTVFRFTLPAEEANLHE